MIKRAEINTVDIRSEGDRVLLLHNGKLLFDMPWDKARVLAKALQAKSLQAEEHAKRDSIIGDQAILTRIGANIGLTGRPDLIHAAGNMAAWDSKLRRYLPGGVKSQESFGIPAIIKHKKD